jgi:hypothetical protein
MIGAAFMLPAEFRVVEEEIEDSDDDVVVLSGFIKYRVLHLKSQKDICI